MNLRLFSLMIGLLLISQMVLKAQKYVNEFLNVGVTGRAQAMSNSVVASVSDISAGYWNPAAMASIQTPMQIAAMHAEWFAGIAKFDYLAVGKKLNPDIQSYGSLAFIRFGVDQIPYTINLIGPEGQIQYDQVSEFAAADYAMLLSYAQQLKQGSNWFVGASAKVIHRSVGSFGKSWGFGTDLGLHYRTDKWNFAVVGRDITTSFNAWSFTLNEREKEVFTQTGNVIPVSSTEITKPLFILGLSRKKKLSQNYSILAEINVDLSTDGKRNVLLSADPISMAPHLGFELEFKNIVQIRGGIGRFQKVKNLSIPGTTRWEFMPSFGLGLVLGDFQLDYALTNIGDVADVNASHIFSILLNMQKKEK